MYGSTCIGDISTCTCQVLDSLFVSARQRRNVEFIGDQSEAIKQKSRVTFE